MSPVRRPSRALRKSLAARCIAILVPAALTACAGPTFHANRPPVIQSVSSTQFGSNSQHSGWNVAVQVSDPDGDSVAVEFIDDAFGVNAVVDASDPFLAAVQVLHEVEDPRLVIRATDGRGGEATHDMDVRQTNRSPLIHLHTVDHNPMFHTSQTTVRALVTDPDADTLTIATSLDPDPAWASLSNATNLSAGIHASTVDANSAPSGGTLRVETVVEDGRGGRATSAFDLGTWRELKAANFLDTQWVGSAGPQSAFQPYALDFDSQGNLWVSSIDTRVIVFTPDGSLDINRNVFWSGSPTIRALLVDESPAGTRFLIGSEDGVFAGQISVFDMQGNALPPLTIGTTDTVPHYLFRRTDDTLLISDNHGRIRHYDPATQTVLDTWGSPGQGAAQYSQPRQIARNAQNDSYYIADRGNNRVRHVDGNGDFVQNIPGGSTPFDIPHGVVLAEGANVLVVADTGKDRIVTMTPTGFVLHELQMGSGSQPRYILQGPDGRLYVTSYTDQRVYILEFE